MCIINQLEKELEKLEEKAAHLKENEEFLHEEWARIKQEYLAAEEKCRVIREAIVGLSRG